MEIRTAVPADLDALTAIEAACFPAAEAAGRESLARRLAVYPEHFWLLLEEGKPVAFVNGMCTDTPDLADEMYEDASLHSESGAWQMIFGVDTAPEYRHHGYASMLLRAAIEDARTAGRAGLVLTCKDRLIGFYERLGFVNEGVSGSTHGDVTWYQMRLRF